MANKPKAKVKKVSPGKGPKGVKAGNRSLVRQTVRPLKGGRKR